MKVFPIFCICTILLSVVCAGCRNNQKDTEPKQEEVTKDTAIFEIKDFFGVTLKGESMSAILKEMEDKVDVLSIKGEINDTAKYYVVEFCGVPCGMNMGWERQDDMCYITSLNFFTSQQTKECVKTFVDGISVYYGEAECEDEGGDVVYAYFFWNGVRLRPVHSEEGGLTVLFD